MTDKPELAQALGLQPHPEGGWYRETWRSAETFVPSSYDGLPRSTATAWQSARPAEPTAVLVSCVVSPGFEFSDFEML